MRSLPVWFDAEAEAQRREREAERREHYGVWAMFRKRPQGVLVKGVIMIMRDDNHVDFRQILYT